MRTIKQLLEIVITSLKSGNKPKWHNNGICGEIKDLQKNLHISHEEKWALLDYISDKRPTRKKYTQFLHTVYEDRVFWWPRMEACRFYREVRINYLKHLISEL